VKKQFPTLSLATVDNTLVEAGLVVAKEDKFQVSEEGKKKARTS
jgi:hypothetical protein